MKVEIFNKIQEANKLFNEGKIKDSLKMFDNLIESEKDVDIYYYKAKILLNNNGRDLALEIVNNGLAENLKSWNLLKLKAEILGLYFTDLASNQLLDNLNNALQLIKNAQVEFDNLSKEQKKEIIEIHFASKEIDVTTEVFLPIKNEMKLLESNINNLRNSVIVLRRVENTEQLVRDSESRLFKERTRTMEILGLFVAIFAFIFSSIQISLKYDLTEAIVLITTIGIVLMCFILALHLAINPEERFRKLIFMFIMLIFILIGLPFIPNLIKGIKYYLRIY